MIKKRKILLNIFWLIFIIFMVSICSSQLSFHKFDEGSGLLARDFAGKHNLTGINVSWTESGVIGYATQLINPRVNPSPEGGYWENTTTGSDLYPDLPFSVNVWYNSSQSGDKVNLDTIIEKASSVSGITRYLIRGREPFNGFQAVVYNGSGTPIIANGVSNTPANKWCMYTLVANGTHLLFYVNGTQISYTGGLSTLYNGTEQPFYIGRSVYDYRYANGSVDLPIVLDYTLSQEDIDWLWNNGSGRNSLIDNTGPKIRIENPVNYYNSSNSSITFEFNASDNLGIGFIQIRSNWTGSWEANYTNSSYGNGDWLNITINNIPDGQHIWGIFANDSANNINQSSNRTFLVDTIDPQISYSTGTENNNTNWSRSWFYVNISITENNFKNLTINLYYSNGTLIASKLFTNSTREYNFTGLSNGIYLYNATSFDDVDRSNSTETRWIRLDTTPPQINIIQPIGTKTNLIINYNVYLSDEVSYSFCTFWIMRGASIETANTTRNCPNSTTGWVNGSAVVSSDLTNYVFFFYANNTARKSNVSNSSFATNIGGTPPPSGGTPPEKDWIMQTRGGGSSYTILIPLGTSRDLSIQFENLEEEELEITLSCEDVAGDICQFVNFNNETKFTLPVLKDVMTEKTFTIIIPEDYEEEGNFSFNINGKPEDGNKKSISVFLNTGKGIWINTIGKLGLRTENGFYYIFIFLPIFLICLFGSMKIIPQKFPLKPIWVLSIVIIIPFFVIYMI